MPLLTEARFLRYQGIFYRKVSQSDMIIQLGIETIPTPSAEFLESFTGSNERIVTWYDFPALYGTDIEFFERSKIQLAEHETGQIFISPLQLIEVFSDFKIDVKSTLIRKNNGGIITDLMIDRIQYLEPLYDSCIAIQMDVKELIRG